MGEKYFYLFESKESCKIILESTYNQKETFNDALKLLNLDSNLIFNIIMIHNDFNDNFESQIQITVSNNELNSLITFIKNLNYSEVFRG